MDSSAYVRIKKHFDEQADLHIDIIKYTIDVQAHLHIYILKIPWMCMSI